METKQVVTFRLNQTDFGIDILKVKEIMRLTTISGLTSTGNHVRGMIDVRGETVPVLDTRLTLGMPSQEESEESRLLLVEVGPRTIALLVDEVSEVLTVSKAKIDSLTDLTGDAVNTGTLEGVVNREEGFLILLNVESLWQN